MGGGDKAMRTVGGKRLFDRVIDRLRPQVSALAINANGAAGRLA
ncbi:MAG: NTP transferase domain-containing protein, partial [Pseudomonadota bacterium]